METRGDVSDRARKFLSRGRFSTAGTSIQRQFRCRSVAWLAADLLERPANGENRCSRRNRTANNLFKKLRRTTELRWTLGNIVRREYEPAPFTTISFN